jgi:hypothetical protein
MLKYALALGLVGGIGVSSGSRPSGCPSDVRRGQAAVRFACILNTAEALSGSEQAIRTNL